MSEYKEKKEDEKKQGRKISIAGIIISTIVFASIFLLYPYDYGIKQILVLWLLSSFYIPILLGVVAYEIGDKKLGKAVIILGIFAIIFFNLSLISATIFPLI